MSSKVMAPPAARSLDAAAARSRQTKKALHRARGIEFPQEMKRSVLSLYRQAAGAATGT